MIAEPPEITEVDLRECLRNLPAGIPVPERVDIAADEDFEGDPVLRMTVVFPASVGVEAAAWKRVHPLLTKLRGLVSERSGHERPVLTEIRRLAEESTE